VRVDNHKWMRDVGLLSEGFLASQSPDGDALPLIVEPENGDVFGRKIGEHDSYREGRGLPVSDGVRKRTGKGRLARSPCARSRAPKSPWRRLQLRSGR
jgi:hypothetical protein